MHASDEREPAVAGQFYTDDPSRLRDQVAEFANGSRKFPERRLRALILPHAGYQYSGPTAGIGFAETGACPSYTHAVVLAPSHRVPFRGVSVGDYRTYKTPLGDLRVDAEVCRALAESCPPVSTRTDAHESEHALEVELPFLAERMPDIALVPVVCGDMTLEQIRETARALADQLAGKDVLWLASSDFTHYGHAFGYVPFVHDVARRLEELDRGALEFVVQRDAAGFLNYIEETGATICGRIPIGLLLEVLAIRDPNAAGHILHYTNVGKMTGSYEHSVSYTAVGFYDSDDVVAREPGNAAEDETAKEEELPATARAALLRLAREAIASRLGGEELQVDPEQLPPVCRRRRACFVTLHKKGRLRGCIGSLEATEELYTDVVHNARNAAFQDPRFPELQEAELHEVDIEISVLTPATPISHPREFEVGRHGIILEKGPYRSVFLPQVAPEQGWDRETTLNYLAMKAGLPENGWRRKATLKVFEAIVFGEKER